MLLAKRNASMTAAEENARRIGVGWLTLLKIKLLDTGLIGSDCRALDTHRILLNSLGGIDGDLIVRLITVLKAEIVVLEVNVEVWVDEFVLDILPDYPSHLISIELDDGILDLDLL
jgi:hypothetical protein